MGHRLFWTALEAKSHQHLVQQISVAVHRCNTAAVLHCTGPDEHEQNNVFTLNIHISFVVVLLDAIDRLKTKQIIILTFRKVHKRSDSCVGVKCIHLYTCTVYYAYTIP